MAAAPPLDSRSESGMTVGSCPGLPSREVLQTEGLGFFAALRMTV